MRRRRGSPPTSFSLIERSSKWRRSAREGLDELAGIHGVGAVKLQRYGAAFLAVIRDNPDA